MFSTTDCWVLFSIGFGEGGITLQQIISKGDMLNHAIVSREELEASLNKLYQNDYIRFEEERFYTTKKAKDFYGKNKRISEGCIVEWLRISEVFKEQLVKPGEIKVIKIADEDYEKSLSAYHQEFTKILKGIRVLPLRKKGIS